MPRIDAAQLGINGIYQLGFAFFSSHKLLHALWAFGTQLSYSV